AARLAKPSVPKAAEAEAEGATPRCAPKPKPIVLNAARRLRCPSVPRKGVPFSAANAFNSAAPWALPNPFDTGPSRPPVTVFRKGTDIFVCPFLLRQLQYSWSTILPRH